MVLAVHKGLGVFVGYDPAEEDNLLLKGCLFIKSHVDGSVDGRLLPINCKASKGVPSSLAGLKHIFVVAKVHIINNMPKLFFEKVELFDSRNTSVSGPLFPSRLVIPPMNSKSEEFEPGGIPKTGGRAGTAFAHM